MQRLRLICLFTTVFFSSLHWQTAMADLNLKLPEIELPSELDYNTPSLGTAQEQQQGLSLLRDLRGKIAMIEDPELCDWVNTLGQRLVNAAPSRSPFYFVIANNNSINAFTLTGGVIVINSGLILASQSESELASVLAHEIAHVTQRHIARMQEENKNSPLMTGLGVLAGAAAASSSPDAAQAIVTGTLAMQAHQQITFSQRAEAEADRVGLKILAQAGFQAEAMPQFLEKLERSESNPYGDLTKYLSTHPMSIERLSDTRSLVNQLPKRKAREDLAYLFAREKIRILTRQTAAPLTAANQSYKTVLNAYAQAYQALQAGKPVLATNTATNQAAITLLKAQALNKIQGYAEAERLLHSLGNAARSQAAIASAIAESQLGLNQPELAVQTLAALRLTETTGLEFFEDAQRIAQQAKQLADASYYNAARSLRLGEYKHAIAAIEQALKLPNTSALTLKRLRALQTEAENALLNIPQR